MVQMVRPDLHVAVDCPEGWTVIEIDEAGLRVSDPTDPRVALQITCDDYSMPMDDIEERRRNGIPADAACEAWTFRRGYLDSNGCLRTDSSPMAAITWSVRNCSFVYRVFVVTGLGRRWTVRLETLQRKEWWSESDVLRTILESIVLL